MLMSRKVLFLAYLAWGIPPSATVSMRLQPSETAWIGLFSCVLACFSSVILPLVTASLGLGRVVESGAEDPGSRRGRWIRCRCCSDRSNFGEPLDRVLVVPADGGFPSGRRLRGDVVRAVVETGGVVG